MYIKRHLESALTSPEFLRGVMAVTGSRQTGKSTLIEEIFKDKELIRAAICIFIGIRMIMRLTLSLITMGGCTRLRSREKAILI